MVVEDREMLTADGRDISEYQILGQDAVFLKFVSDIDSMDSAPGYHPEFVHQHFGEQETITGFKNLKVTIYYTDRSLYFWPKIEHEGVISQKFPDIVPDDIMLKLKENLPDWHFECMVGSLQEFKNRLDEQKKKLTMPEGDQIGAIRRDDKVFNVFKVKSNDRSEDFDLLITRAETLSLWYIDAADYTDNSDWRFDFFFLYEVVEAEGTKEKIYKVAGYAVTCNYHMDILKKRPRFAHIMLLPHYRKSGIGAYFLSELNKHFVADSKVVDVTAYHKSEQFS
ncbi:hypothetical protein L596_018511 [Steinernema carpocapsae]|nr:hypothetical protein L596_018511 [Steinernema carpocapsae]